MQTSSAQLLPEATRDLQAWAAAHLAPQQSLNNDISQLGIDQLDDDAWTRTKELVTGLGSYWQNGTANFGFWVPDIGQQAVLEIFTPLEDIALEARASAHDVSQQTVQFRLERIPVQPQGQFVWAVVDGLLAGSRTRFGSFYRLQYQDSQGNWRYHYDPMAVSLPFGAFAPAELYDLAGLDHERADRDYFLSFGSSQDAEVSRLGAPVNILQVHVPTASAGGTLASLTRQYQALANKLQTHDPLTPAEHTYLAYDAIQLMPIEPIIEFEDGPKFWQEPKQGLGGVLASRTIDVTLMRPHMTNWGYDVVIAGSAAVNPVLLETGRPDELVDLAATLHTFPGKPIQLIFDVVFGHADNQALPLLASPFFSGSNMYGQNLNYRVPLVRAMLLEMQRRKANFGVDGLRVDGAQDFKHWDATAKVMKHDDAYLLEMSEIVQHVAGVYYQPWMIFEDGRPWPREDWETASSYLDVINQQPHTFQWGPLTFAHNTPCLESFWTSKWWRIEEIAVQGSHWISGCANHDTLRRGYQLPIDDPDRPINQRLGDSLPDILRRSYDHPAASLLTYGVFPGVPMDFINATSRAPWAFMRNTDKRYAVKVVAEEGGFFIWQVSAEVFNHADAFTRLKALGFSDLDMLRKFAAALETAVHHAGDDLLQVLALLSAQQDVSDELNLSEAFLARYARAFMDDLYEYCNVSHYQDSLNLDQCAFNMALRNFRRQHPWLADNLRSDEILAKRVDDGTTLVYAVRLSEDSSEQVVLLANMEGEPVTVVPREVLPESVEPDGWQVAVAAPGVKVSDLHTAVYLKDSEGVLFYRELL
ncbi:MAG: glucosylglycerol hydrolase [Deinococcota bacterium]